MAQVFVNPYKAATQTWSAQTAFITFEKNVNSTTATLTATDKAKHFGAVTDVQIQLSRGIRTIYPVGGNEPFRIVGVPDGTLTISSFIGPTTQLKDFLEMFGDVCNTFSLQIKSPSNTAEQKIQCLKSAKVQTLSLKDCTGQTMVYDLRQAQDGMSIATGQFTIKFTNLDWEPGA